MKKFRDCTDDEVMEYCNDRWVKIGCTGCPLYKGICIRKVDKKYLSKKALNFELPIKNNILNDVEREYLSNVIRPFRNRVLNITKKSSAINTEEYIAIIIASKTVASEYINLPYFKKGTMYKGMELEKEYTLKEVEL
ncbi:MAG: hypothetical protein ACI4WW_02715 [Candidatus Coprovivens sp.]